MQISAREAALTALERCRRDGAWSGASIDNIIKKYGLEKREAALASRLCLGVLQNTSFCDYYIDYYYSGKGGKLEPKLRDILRLGAYQLLLLDRVPASAAVNESVSLAKRCGFARASGLVNAVLRRLGENRGKLPEIPGAGTADYLSVKYSHPKWLCRRIAEEQGYAFAEDFLAANNCPPGLTIQVNTLKVTEQEYIRALLRAGIEFTASSELPGCIELAGGSVIELPGYEEGLFYVQDRAARSAVEIARPRKGDQVLDACAAPGGKSFTAAILMGNEGYILSCDIHEKKLALIRSGAGRLGIEIINTQTRDARLPEEAFEGRFDLVIADVPCSGLGVIRKKPEIRFKDEKEIAALPEIQRRILESLSSCVKPGGCLLYSTCTVLKCENEDVVESFLAAHPDFTAEDYETGGVCSKRGMRCFWPNVDGTDGFFAAKMRRTK